MKEDLQNIKKVGIQIESVTCDGATNILKAVREVCPEAVVQRCTFHIAHEIQTWLTKKTKSEAARELLDIVRYLNRVETNEDAQLWMRAFIDWYRVYEEFINEKSMMKRGCIGGINKNYSIAAQHILSELCPICLVLPDMIISLKPRIR